MSAPSSAGRLADERPPPPTTPGASAKPFADEEEEKKIVTDAQKELGNMLDEIAERFPGRSIPFTDEEKKIVTDAQRELGNKWTEIAKRLPGRSTTRVRNWWHNRLSAQRERVMRKMEGTRQEEAHRAKRAKTESQKAKEGLFTEEEKRIVIDAQRELGNRWAEIAERLPGLSRKQVKNWWHNRSEKQKRKRRREEEGSATPGPPPKIGSKRAKTESQEVKVGGMSLSEGGGAPKDDIQSGDAHDASPRNGATGELDGPREEGQCVGIAKQIIAQNEWQMEEVTNLHALQNMSGITFEQAMQLYIHQCALRGNGMTHELMVDAIDQAIAQEVQRTALANDLHAPPTMAEKDNSQDGTNHCREGYGKNAPEE